MSRYYRSILAIGGGIDPDAEAFLVATEITDATISSAINLLVKDLKSADLWTKFRFIYPFVGGTATTNKFNLKDPRDLDVAFRLSFSGGITHTNGFNPNGTNGYANSYCSPNGNVTLNSEHIYITSNTNNTPTSSDPVDIGCFTAMGTASLFGMKRGGNTAVSRMNNEMLSYLHATGIASFCAVKNGDTNLKLFKNAILRINGVSGGILSPLPIYIGAMARSSAYMPHYTNQNYTFATYGDGLTDTDVANLTTIEQNFNTTLGR